MIDTDKNEIKIEVGFPDSLREMHKDPRYPFPDIQLQSTVRIVGEGSSVRIFVDLKEPLPEKWKNKVEFRLELFPGHFFDKTYYMDGTPGSFPRQANGPFITAGDGSYSIKPLATGKKLVALPESKHDMLTIESLYEDLELVDSRGRNKAGWFAVRSSLKAGVTENALEWIITPAVKPDFE